MWIKSMITGSCLLTGLMVITPAPAMAQDAGVGPPEFGLVNWRRDVDSALAEAQNTGKPVFALFQQLNGSHNCVKYGRITLRHPLIVDALDHEFIPLLVLKNLPGPDGLAAQRFGEPIKADPVVRYFDARGKDLILREEEIWRPEWTAQRMIKALIRADRKIPKYLKMAATEYSLRELQTATFGMHCFWEGQAALGSVPGVIGAKCAWIGDQEIVQVLFDPKLLSYRNLVRRAQRLQCTDRVYAHNDRQFESVGEILDDGIMRMPNEIRPADKKDHLHILNQSNLKYLPLSELQALKINSIMQNGRSGRNRYLSPTQIRMMSDIKNLYEANPKAFAGLQRPELVFELPGYYAQLRSVLKYLAPNVPVIVTTNKEAAVRIEEDAGNENASGTTGS